MMTKGSKYITDFMTACIYRAELDYLKGNVRGTKTPRLSGWEFLSRFAIIALNVHERWGFSDVQLENFGFMEAPHDVIGPRKATAFVVPKSFVNSGAIPYAFNIFDEKMAYGQMVRTKVTKFTGAEKNDDGLLQTIIDVTWAVTGEIHDLCIFSDHKSVINDFLLPMNPRFGGTFNDLTLIHPKFDMLIFASQSFIDDLNGVSERCRRFRQEPVSLEILRTLSAWLNVNVMFQEEAMFRWISQSGFIFMNWAGNKHGTIIDAANVMGVPPSKIMDDFVETALSTSRKYRFEPAALSFDRSETITLTAVP